jgi:Domain of unknown function (DUF4126)
MGGDWLGTLGFAMGSAWLSGINLYATVATLGLLQRFHLVHLPGDLSYFTGLLSLCHRVCRRQDSSRR